MKGLKSNDLQCPHSEHTSPCEREALTARLVTHDAGEQCGTAKS